MEAQGRKGQRATGSTLLVLEGIAHRKRWFWKVFPTGTESVDPIIDVAEAICGERFALNTNSSSPSEVLLIDQLLLCKLALKKNAPKLYNLIRGVFVFVDQMYWHQHFSLLFFSSLHRT